MATGRKVAVKLLHSDMTYDNEVVARLRREVMLVCKLRDAHTATIYDVDQTPWGTPYIAMELLEGESLNHTLCLGPLEWKRVFKILVEACSSLAEAHAQGIVHRNLKPENIYLEWRSGNLEFTKILDYGIANLFGRGQRTRGSLPSTTNVLPLVQVLEYASPEQLMGRALDGRSDIYALGVLAYAMITWRLPFPEARGPQGLISAQLKQTPSAPSLVCPGARLPRAADRAILRCLEKDRHNRYPDVTQLAAELQALIADPRGA
ncbi:MAG TPA: serine/threonine-protein kinase [Kofleriaceae bacterium]